MNLDRFPPEDQLKPEEITGIKQYYKELILRKQFHKDKDILAKKYPKIIREEARVLSKEFEQQAKEESRRRNEQRWNIQRPNKPLVDVGDRHLRPANADKPDEPIQQARTRPNADVPDKKPQFLMVDFEMLDSPEYRQNHRDKTNLYLWLRRHIRRGPWQDDPLDIYGNYYKKGRLATSRSLRRLATDFGVKNTTAINRWINELEQEGAFKIEKGNVGKPRPQNIYVLGEVRDGEEMYYYNNAVQWHSHQ